jgi:hypothetical protein
MPRIKVDLIEYEIPGMDTLTMREWKVLTKQSGLLADEIQQLGDRVAAHPGCLTGLLQIAITRQNPTVPVAEVEKRIDDLTMQEISDGLIRDEPAGGESSPPAEGSPSVSEPISESSGESGNTTGEPSQGRPTPSDTGSQPSEPESGSDRAISAA